MRKRCEICDGVFEQYGTEWDHAETLCDDCFDEIIENVDITEVDVYTERMD